MNDSDLLRRFVDEHSQDAFAELVRRHIGLVYSAALRQVGGDAHHAEDVTQEVFIDLAGKARSLTRHPALIGWLYTSTHFAAAKLLRTEQRRARREQEAHTMNDSPASLASQPDWDRVRPVLDAAMHELDERDRQTVLLRFFDQQPFARIGEELGLSENAAQKAADRALDKLQAALARRGVKSTSAALGLALASQAGAAAPATLATSITGAALAGTGGAAATGLFSLLSTSKVVVALSCGVAILAGGVALIQDDRTREAEATLLATQQRQHASQAQVTAMAARLSQAEQRAIEAEKDTGELLKAVEALKAQQTARAAQTATAKVAEADERLAQERTFQQELAKRRAQEAIARAKIQSEAAAEEDPVARYHKFIEAAENFAANADFNAAVQTFNDAMQMKPADLVLTDQVKQLQATFRAQNAPVEVALISDGLTMVSLTGPYGQRAPSPLQTTAVKVLPGNYEVIGRRKGYQDVVIPVLVRNGVPPPVISVACTVPATR